VAQVVIFFVMAGLALVAALGVVLARNPVHSALSLVVVLVSIAVLFVIQDAQLLAAVQVIVYAGAIVVLFLFVIMLLGVDERESLRDPVKLQRPAAIALGVIALLEVIFLEGHHWATGAHAVRGSLHADGGTNVQEMARSLFTTFLWPFEITAVLLVIAVVGSVVIARRSDKPLPPEDEAAIEDDEADVDHEEQEVGS
jgi:NADH-quinone oxidoreductase subunit J